MPIQIESRFCGHVAILECSGRIVLGEEANALDAALQTTTLEFHRVVLNLAEVTRLDSYGLGVIVRYSSNLRKRGGDLRLAAPRPFVTEILEITLLSSVFQSFPTEDQAIHSFLTQTPAPTAAPQSGRHVLVVDRSPDLGAFVRAVLTQYGYEVKSASLVSDARVLLQCETFDYILVGPGSPQMPSATALAALKNLAPQATALELTRDFRTFDAKQAAEILLEMFQSP
ncbi:MAG TPA: STAS domain-containing protein [Acidobacteriaceae bacterium]|jgi:anti-sigma B factor antagonist|nr:STAS domain-containing protein [Acidobacteriaceae bacterium]